VDLSGIIFVVLAVAWAVYLIPKALRHHDEVARTRSIDRFSTAMRVLARREPVNRRDARLVVAPARAAGNPRVLTPSRPPEPEAPVSVDVKPAASRARLEARRKAARAAARRRRHILTFLLISTVATTATAYLAYVPWWSVAIPGGLTLAYLVLCRTQVRRESLRDFEVLTEQRQESGDATAVPRRAVRVEVRLHARRIDHERGGERVEAPAVVGGAAAPGFAKIVGSRFRLAQGATSVSSRSIIRARRPDYQRVQPRVYTPPPQG